MDMLVRIFSLLIASSLITACSMLPAKPSDDTTEVDEHSDRHISDNSQVPAVLYDRPFAAPTLYSLLVAEVAGQRQQFDISLVNYLDQAEKTQDPGIAERATHIAQYMGVNNYTLRAAEVWVKNAPDEAQAHQVLAQALVVKGDFENALKHLEIVFDLAGASQFDYLALNAEALNPEDKIALLQQIEQLTKKIGRAHV